MSISSNPLYADIARFSTFLRFKHHLLCLAANERAPRDICDWALRDVWFGPTFARVARAIHRGTFQALPLEDFEQRAALNLFRKFCSSPALGIDPDRPDLDARGLIHLVMKRACLDARERHETAVPNTSYSLDDPKHKAAMARTDHLENVVQIVDLIRTHFDGVEREALLQLALGECTQLTEVANHLGVSYHTLYAKLTRAKVKLRQLIQA